MTHDSHSPPRTGADRARVCDAYASTRLHHRAARFRSRSGLDGDPDPTAGGSRGRHRGRLRLTPPSRRHADPRPLRRIPLATRRHPPTRGHGLRRRPRHAPHPTSWPPCCTKQRMVSPTPGVSKTPPGRAAGTTNTSKPSPKASGSRSRKTRRSAGPSPPSPPPPSVATPTSSSSSPGRCPPTGTSNPSTHPPPQPAATAWPWNAAAPAKSASPTRARGGADHLRPLRHPLHRPRQRRRRDNDNGEGDAS